MDTGIYIFNNQNKWHFKGDHSPDNVKFPHNSLTVRGTQHVKCYSYHARTGVTVSGGGRNATVHDLKPYT